MALFEAGLNDPAAVKVWGQGTMAEALHQTSLSRLSGSGPSAYVRMFDELQSGKGDRYRHFLRGQSDGVGVGENEVLESQEESMTHYSDDVYIGEFHNAVRTRWKSSMTNQRVPYSLREEAKSQLSDWARNRFDEILWNHACGFTPANSYTKADLYRGYNTIVEYDANHRVFAGTGNAADEDLGGGDTMTLAVVDKAIEKIKTMDRPILPGKYGDHYGYAMGLHPFQVSALRAEGSDWYEICKASMQGGRIDDNPLITGALGVYNDVLFFEQKRIKQGVNSSTGAVIDTVRRAPLFGANGFMCGYGRYSSRPEKMKWIEKLHDYDRELGVAASFTHGLKRTIFDGETYGALLVSTTAESSN